MNLPNHHVIEADGFGVNRLSLWTVGNRFIFSQLLSCQPLSDPELKRYRLYSIQKSALFRQGSPKQKVFLFLDCQKAVYPFVGSMYSPHFLYAQKVKRKFGKKL